jgi:Flp pilus assembly protein TadG
MLRTASILNNHALKRIRRFISHESGNATVEAALWLPFFLITLMGAGQVALIFFGQSVALTAAQNATRAYSVGEIQTDAEIVSYVQKELSGISDTSTVNVAVNNDLITTFVTVPASEFGGPLKFIPQFANLNVRVFAQQRKEF